MRRIVWLIALWLGWQVFKEARREFADTQPALAPFPGDDDARPPRDARYSSS